MILSRSDTYLEVESLRDFFGGVELGERFCRVDGEGTKLRRNVFRIPMTTNMPTISGSITRTEGPLMTINATAIPSKTPVDPRRRWSTLIKSS